MRIVKKNLSTVVLLLVVLFAALFLRFYSLSEVPNGFHIDEASLGYNAYSILLTGKDSDGHKLPLHVSMFNDNNPSGYYYLTVLSIKTFGLNEFATRFPAALFGSLSVLAVFILSFAIFRDKKISFISALLTVIAPWNVVLSRASAETIVALFFVIFGFSFVVISFYNKNIKYLLLGTVSLFASFFIYPAPRVFVPLFFFILLIFFISTWYKNNNFKYKVFILSSFLFLALSSAVLVFIVSGGSARFNQVSIFNFPETNLVKAEQIREDGVFGINVPVTRSFHNKVINYSLTFTSNYLQYFTGDFLFIKGGLPSLLRVPGMGLVYLIELPFILLGVIYLVKNKNSFYKIPLLWLLIAPVAASLTVDDIPNTRRALVMFPAVEIIVAYGLFVFMGKYQKSKKFLLFIVFTFLLFNFSYFMHQYFVHAQINRNWYRNEGFGDMVALVKKDYSSYDKIIVTKSLGGIYPLILFYMKYDPTQYQKEGSPKDKSNMGFGKFFFADPGCPSIDKSPTFPKVGKVIYVDNGNCPEYKSLKDKKYKYITRKDGTRVFRIVYE